MLTKNKKIYFLYRYARHVFMHLGPNVVHILCSCVLLSFRVTVNSNPAV